MKSIIIRNRFLCLTLLIIIAVLFDLITYSFTLEDAQITFRYSLRFSEGYPFGMWNRTGNPVEGFTTFLWMIYLSVFGPNLETIVNASKITSILSHISIVVLFFILFLKFSRSKNHSTGLIKMNTNVISGAFFFTSVSIATFLPLTWYVTSGMETVLFIALISYVIFLPLVTTNVVLISVLSALLVLLRPDGIMFALLSSLYYFVVTKEKKFILVGVVSIGVLLSLTYFRYLYFGYMMPNTYYAKSANAIGYRHLFLGIVYFGEFFINYIYLFIPIFFMLKPIFLRKRILEYRFFLLIFFSIIIYFIVIAKAGGDNLYAFPFWRHALNIFPLLLFCVFISVFSLYKKHRHGISFFIVSLLFISPLVLSLPLHQAKLLRNVFFKHIQEFPNLNNNYGNNPLLLWIKSISNENTKIATPLAGALPLTVDAYHIDILGLNNEFIAHNGSFDPHGQADSKTDMNYLLSQSPDIIEGYMDAEKILKGVDLENVVFHSRRKMNTDLILNETFQKEYLIITNAPYEELNRILFIRKEFYDKIKYNFDVKVMPLDRLIATVKK